MKLLITMSVLLLAIPSFGAESVRDYSASIQSVDFDYSMRGVTLSATVRGGGCHTVSIYPDFEVVETEEVVREQTVKVYTAHLKILSNESAGNCRMMTYPELQNLDVSELLNTRLKEAGWERARGVRAKIKIPEMAY